MIKSSVLDRKKISVGTGSGNKKHITLVRTPIVSSLHSFSSPITAPLALAYLSASLDHSGFNVTAIDALGENIEQINIYDNPSCRVRGLTIEEILARIPRDTDIIALSCMFSQEWIFVKKIIESIGKKFPGKIIIVGGEHVNAMPEEILKASPEIDCCALGEGEETIVDIARNFPQNARLIAGIVYRDSNGKINRNEKRPRIKNLEDIPRPNWDIFPIENYLAGNYSQGINAGRSIPILATRGCPFQCTFCSNKDMWTQRYYTRSPEDVIDEIKSYIEKYKINTVEFFDLTAIIDKDWIVQFGKLLKENDLDISWSLPSGTRSESLDEEVTKLLGETNCKYLVYAAESGSPRILKYVKKEVDLDRMLKSMKSAKKNGLSLRCNLMLGIPIEERIDVLKTIWFQVKLAWIGVDDAPLYMFSPYPGTVLYKYLREIGKVPEPDDDYFRSLLCQMDLTHSSTLCENIGRRELAFYRLFGMSLFYFLSYVLRPYRIIRSIRNIFFTKQTDTVFEQRLVDIYKARKQSRKKIKSLQLSHEHQQ